jgi:effector-binding domain-containing protein
MRLAPTIEYRHEQPYMGMVAEVTMPEIGTVIPPLLDDLTTWLENKNVTPAGASFFRYLRIDMEGTLDIEIGIPVHHLLSGEGEIRPRTLPSGHYATVLHTGHYDQLRDVTGTLLEWGEANGVVWAVAPSERGDLWESRLEIYLNDPADTPPDQWQTELAFLLGPQS